MVNLEKYEDVFGFNLEGYYFDFEHGIQLKEFVPSQPNFEELAEKPGYGGVCFIFDNINRLLWVYQDDSVRTKKIIKKFKSEKNENKLVQITVNLFANELSYDVRSYEIRRALQYEAHFMQVFKYQINEHPMYSKHYLLPQYEHVADLQQTSQDDGQEDTVKTTKECQNCGWVVSVNAEVCPKCRRPVDKKFSGKQ